MNCKKARMWISADLDGELSPREKALLEAHLAGCATCRRMREKWGQFGIRMRTAPAPAAPSSEAAWEDIRRTIRTIPRERRIIDASWVFGPGLKWAVAALLVIALGAGIFGVRPRGRSLQAEAPPAAEVELVETGLPGASPMVYEDAESGWMVIWIVEGNHGGGGHAGS